MLVVDLSRGNPKSNHPLYMSINHILLFLLFGNLLQPSLYQVFHFSRRSERERELRSPNSCGVGGRRWKGPARREACAAHTIPLSLDQLVEFWSVQVEETRQSLFRMKEEDFVGHLLVRFGPGIN